jgi:signal transduction histidine kinase
MLQLSSQLHVTNAEVVIEGPLGAVTVDAELMTMAVKQVLDNAIKFSRSDVRPRVIVSARHSDTNTALRFADQGIGLAPEYREKAFRMFWQLSPERGRPGVGAGLALARRIARRHGGDTRFVEASAGACVEINLPSSASATTGD